MGMRLAVNGIQIEVEDSSQMDRPVVLLIMGLGMQLIAWPPGLVRALQNAGYRVLRFDNRDAGLSTAFAHAGVPNLLWQGVRSQLGLSAQPAYTLQDMANDALGVLDALHIAQAHVLGISMGGMIAQRVAIRAPQRIKTLTSIMSSSGAPGLPLPDAKVMQLLLSRPAAPGMAAAVDHMTQFLQAVASPGYPTDLGLLRTMVSASLARSHRPEGIARQMHAVMADSARADLLSGISAPTLVIHGQADPLVPLACGEDTARRIPGARLLTIAGMAHDLPVPVVNQIIDNLLPFLNEHP